MYACSNAFHQAVQQGEPQKLLMIFPDAVFTEEDIDLQEGLEFHDYFNLEEDLSIGQTTSNEITFTIVNRDRLLNEYEFGEFTALLGVRVEQSSYTHSGSVYLQNGNTTWQGNATAPVLRRNGVTVQSPPSFPVASIMAYDGKVWVFGESGQYAVYTDLGTNITPSNPVNAFMRNKAKGWAGRGYAYSKSTRMLSVFEQGTVERYEFVPLGVFIADRPNAPDKIWIHFDCFDRMQKFDRDMPAAEEMGMSYPAPISTLYARMCTAAGVPRLTGNFINSSATIPEEPEEFADSTMRTVLGWIAEAAGSNARFDRDGNLKMDWIRQTNVSIDEHGWSEFEPYWYTTGKVGRIHRRDTSSDEEEIVEASAGTTENYLIQNNPLMR